MRGILRRRLLQRYRHVLYANDADIHEQLWQSQAKRVRKANKLLDGWDVHASFDFGESRTGDTGARGNFSPSQPTLFANRL